MRWKRERAPAITTNSTFQNNGMLEFYMVVAIVYVHVLFQAALELRRLSSKKMIRAEHSMFTCHSN
jgi:hypothetical protein